MKKSDWALVILIVAVVAVISWFVIGSLLPPPENETVKTAPSLTSEIIAPENNVILYDADKPSWCFENAETDNSEVVAIADENNEDETIDSSEENSGSTDGRQYINSAFNVCGINSSFTTTTE